MTFLKALSTAPVAPEGVLTPSKRLTTIKSAVESRMDLFSIVIFIVLSSFFYELKSSVNLATHEKIVDIS